jgi:hypothetical protein
MRRLLLALVCMGAFAGVAAARIRLPGVLDHAMIVKLRTGETLSQRCERVGRCLLSLSEGGVCYASDGSVIRTGSKAHKDLAYWYSANCF